MERESKEKIKLRLLGGQVALTALGRTGEHWGALGSTEEHWGALRSTGEHWGALGNTGAH